MFSWKVYVVSFDRLTVQWSAKSPFFFHRLTNVFSLARLAAVHMLDQAGTYRIYVTLATTVVRVALQPVLYAVNCLFDPTRRAYTIYWSRFVPSSSHVLLQWDDRWQRRWVFLSSSLYRCCDTGRQVELIEVARTCRLSNSIAVKMSSLDLTQLS